MEPRKDLFEAREKIFEAMQLIRRAMPELYEDDRRFLEQVVLRDLLEALNFVTEVALNT